MWRSSEGLAASPPKAVISASALSVDQMTPGGDGHGGGAVEALGEVHLEGLERDAGGAVAEAGVEFVLERDEGFDFADAVVLEGLGDVLDMDDRGCVADVFDDEGRAFVDEAGGGAFGLLVGLACAAGEDFGGGDDGVRVRRGAVVGGGLPPAEEGGGDAVGVGVGRGVAGFAAGADDVGVELAIVGGA